MWTHDSSILAKPIFSVFVIRICITQHMKGHKNLLRFGKKAPNLGGYGYGVRPNSDSFSQIWMKFRSSILSRVFSSFLWCQITFLVVLYKNTNKILWSMNTKLRATFSAKAKFAQIWPFWQKWQFPHKCKTSCTRSIFFDKKIWFFFLNVHNVSKH